MCFINCPSDCVMSEWSSWTGCGIDTPKKCGIFYQKRSRYLKSENFGGGRPCPIPKNQMRVCSFIIKFLSCLINIRIFSLKQEYQKKPCYAECMYQWKPESWTTCKNMANSCGRFNKGTKSRKIKCININDGMEVDASNCDPEEAPADLEECIIACPGECVLSLWSEWSLCLPVSKSEI